MQLREPGGSSLGVGMQELRNSRDRSRLLKGSIGNHKLEPVQKSNSVLTYTSLAMLERRPLA